MPNGNDRYLFDTSAILAFWQDEAEAPQVRDLIQQASRGTCEAYISFMTIFEAYYITKRETGENKANEIYYYLHNFPFERVNMEEDILITAGNLKARYRLGVGDAWIAATAISLAAMLVYKDPDFDPVQEVSQLRISS